MFRLFFLPFLASLALSVSAADDYKLGPLSQENPAVPKGKVTQMPVHESKIFPGTKRDWWIYVPAQYSPEKPANLMVFQDGHDYVGTKGAWRAPAGT
jgi:enterochelin esterase family protein